MALTDQTESAAEFPLAEWLLGVEDAGDRLTGRIRHCSRSAFVHLRKAWRLHGIDDEMSVFRAITQILYVTQSRHRASANGQEGLIQTTRLLVQA